MIALLESINVLPYSDVDKLINPKLMIGKILTNELENFDELHYIFTLYAVAKF